MCLAIPGKVIELDGVDALVDFDGVKRKVVVGLCENVHVGTYVIVHAGYAIETIDEKTAKESIEIWRNLVEEENLDKENII